MACQVLLQPFRLSVRANFRRGTHLETQLLHRMCLVIVAFSSLGTPAAHTAAQNESNQKIDVMAVPDITIQSQDYADARKTFRTGFCTKALPPIKRTAKHPSRLSAFPKSTFPLAPCVSELG